MREYLRIGKLQSRDGEQHLPHSDDDVHGNLEEQTHRVGGMQLHHTARVLIEKRHTNNRTVSHVPL